MLVPQVDAASLVARRVAFAWQVRDFLVVQKMSEADVGRCKWVQGPFTCTASLPNRQVFGGMVNTLNGRLAQYRTTIDEDTATLLGASATESRKRFSLRYRLGHKRLLRGLASFLETQPEPTHEEL
jgi:hypothetical protein